METIGSRIKELREEKGWSQTELAKAANLKNQSIIGMLESNQRKSSSHIPSIAAALGVESLWLTTGKGVKSKSELMNVRLSDMAMKIAVIVDTLPSQTKDAILHLVTQQASLLSAQDKAQEHQAP